MSIEKREKNKAGKIVVMWRDERLEKWVIGIQGTSRWYTEESFRCAMEIYKKLINGDDK